MYLGSWYKHMLFDRRINDIFIVNNDLHVSI